jgi:hypothetical protein
MPWRRPDEKTAEQLASGKIDDAILKGLGASNLTFFTLGDGED